MIGDNVKICFCWSPAHSTNKCKSNTGGNFLKDNSDISIIFKKGQNKSSNLHYKQFTLNSDRIWVS